MINEDKTFKIFGYNSTELSKGSHKQVYAQCNHCGREKLLSMNKYNQTQGRCYPCSIQHHNRSGENSGFYGKSHSVTTKHKMSKAKQGIYDGNKNPMYGKHHTEETKHKQSQSNSKENHPQWKGGRKLSRAKCDAKRKQLFGFIPHNAPQENFHGHHIDFEHVIFIPKEIHMSVQHSVTLSQNMDLINDIACDWYLKYQVSNINY